MREGDTDPLSGQKGAFPLENNPELERVNAYLENVRREAQNLVIAAAERNSQRQLPTDNILDWGSPVANKIASPISGVSAPKLAVALPNPACGVSEKSGLSGEKSGLSNEKSGFGSDKYAEIINYTGKLCQQKFSPDCELVAVFQSAHTLYSALPSIHPEECVSLATWKKYTSENDPKPLNQIDTFRVLKYLLKWNYSSEQHFRWCWALLLRVPSVLTGDEIAVLRAVCKQLRAFQNVWYDAFATILSKVFGQLDMALVDELIPPK